MNIRKHLWSKLGPALLCLLPGVLSAAPVDGVFAYYQPDGRKVNVQVKGDEFFAEERTLDGQLIVQDPVTKFWCYARLSEDGTDLESTGIPAGDEGHRTFTAESLPAYFRIQTPKERRVRIDELNREKLGRDRRGRFLPPSGGKDLLMAPGEGSAPETISYVVSRTTLGTKRGLTMLVRFPDRAVDVTISRGQVESYCNQTSTHYTEYSNNGSVSEYFADVSNGKLTYTNTVAEYYTAKNVRSYYTDETASRAPELVKEALNSLEAAGFDFRTVDADGNGAVDALNVFYAGPVVNAWAKGLWPHASGISWQSAKTGIKVTVYQISAIGSKLELGTFCHENGHMLCGFPDVYDYDGDSVGGSGTFDLMCAGGHGTNPRAPNGYLRYKAGWGSVEWLGNGVNATKTLTAESGGRLANQFIGFANPANTKEYFLLENFYKNDRNSGAPTSGMAVWHVDEQGDHNKQSYSHNTTHNNYEVALIQADNQRHFERNVSSGDARDLFYAGNAAAGYLNEFSDTTDGGAYDNNAHWRSGTKSGLKLSGFSGPGNTMSVIVQTPGSVALSANPTAFTFTSAAGSKTSALTANVNWTAAANQSWISVTPTSGSSNATLTITVQANTSASARTGQITLTGSGATPVTLTVSQSGVSTVLSANPTALSFTSAAGSKTSALTANVSWTASANQSWISVTPASGSSNATLTITAQANTSASTRTGQITLTGSGATPVTLTVSQSGVSTGSSLAKGKPTTASSVEVAGLEPAKAVDGSTTTRWSSAFSDPQWITVDLGQNYAINKVVLAWEAAYGKDYEIRVSSDNQTWKSIYTSNNAGKGGTESLTVSGTGRYVQMYGKARGTVYGYSLWEFEVYGTSAPTTPMYSLKNRWLSTYLYDGGDQLKYGASVADNSYKWIVEDLGNGQKELRNVGTGHYIHIENLQDWAQCTTRTSGWWSSRWTIEDAGSGYIRFKNVWQTSNYLHVEGQKGYAQRGTLGSTGWWSAQWQMVAVP